MPPSKVPNVKTLYDCGDLENKVKVKLTTCQKRSCQKVLGVNIKSLLKMVTDKLTSVCPVGYNRKIELWPIKYRNEDTMTFFGVCLVGVHRSDMGPLSPTVSELYA